MNRSSINTTFICFFVILLCSLHGCKKRDQKEKSQAVFTYIPVSQSHVSFENRITENDSVNALAFQYCYNGGGVGIGDFNRDGLSDIVFTGNQVSSALYLNQGDFRFKDVTTLSGMETKAWVNGVSIVDINADGWDDIYFSVGGVDCKNNCHNLLFINQGVNATGIPLFVEQAAQYGLDDGNYSQQTAFFDYDGDGDLDAYIVHNGNTNRNRNQPIEKRYFPRHLEDYLLENTKRNDTVPVFFSNVSTSLGIAHAGFGLGIGINDLNNDHLPDIYVSNDFITNDLVYLNRGVGADQKHLGFDEVNGLLLKKQTYNAMGVDVSDIDNDQLPDITVVDMLPKDYERQKKMLGFNNYDKYLLSQRNQYTPQYVHNSLQLHNGMWAEGILPSSDVGYSSGIASTDWSWAPVVADYDNDGLKDLYITNGYVKDITDLDFINYSTDNSMFGTPEAKQKKMQKAVDELPGIFLPNVMYRNKGAATFEDVSESWIAQKPSFSNGAAYADLDQDGDLDLVVNNINSPAFILENHTVQNDSTSSYLRIRLQGTKLNANAIGAKVTVFEKDHIQLQYQSVIRGYLSSVEPILHFGVTTAMVDSVHVLWPNGSTTVQKNIKANQIVTITLDSTAVQTTQQPIQEIPTLFRRDTTVFQFQHQENYWNDYVQQSLLPSQFHAKGPCIAAADINGIPGDELFIGGSTGSAGVVYAQNAAGVYEPVQELDAMYEDTAATFIDIDGDGDRDLYVASGGTESRNAKEALQDRVYLNDGKGKLTRNLAYLKTATPTNTSCIAIGTKDNQGTIPIFIGGGVLPGSYPLSAPSYILNRTPNGLEVEPKGIFSNQGIVTDAVWADLNGNSNKELIVVGHWMPITVYTKEEKQAKELSITWKNKAGEKIDMSGLWNAVQAADFDNDGDLDLIAGNQGTNGFIQPSFGKPVYVYKQDLDQNGSIDPVLGQHFATAEGSVLKPIHTRDDIIKQLVFLKKTYGTYDQFAKATFEELLNIKNLEEETLSAAVFTSVYAENVGNNTFIVHELPPVCQRSSINDFLIEDYNHDGYPDVLLVGNDYTAEANYGRHDGMIGLYIQGSAQGLLPIAPQKSGFVVPKQSNHIISVKDRKDQSLIIATQNNDEARVFQYKK